MPSEHTTHHRGAGHAAPRWQGPAWAGPLTLAGLLALLPPSYAEPPANPESTPIPVTAEPGAFALSAGIITHTLESVPYDWAREALEEAIAAEGLAAPVISYFGDMLARTAKDLGHPATLYRDAHIYTFCSVSAAATLAVEAPEAIALCPLSIAIYSVEQDRVVLAYRPLALGTPGGLAADQAMARIVAGTRAMLGLD